MDICVHLHVGTYHTWLNLTRAIHGKEPHDSQMCHPKSYTKQLVCVDSITSFELFATFITRNYSKAPIY